MTDAEVLGSVTGIVLGVFARDIHCISSVSIWMLELRRGSQECHTLVFLSVV